MLVLFRFQLVAETILCTFCANLEVLAVFCPHSEPRACGYLLTCSAK